MDMYEYAKQTLLSPNMDEKLSITAIDKTFKPYPGLEIPTTPGRLDRLKFSEKQAKFPKRPSLRLDEKKAQALHFFANHELQALEMMAAAILKFPTETLEDHKYKLGIIGTIQDEKKHFLLYTDRVKEMGHEFGDFPIGDFFWRQLPGLETKSQYYAYMALTLEAANLDFAKYYGDVFTEIDDQKTANILNTVYEDEIRHVGLGRKWLNLWRGDKSLWQYYTENLPNMITPARSKGMIFDKKGRVKSGLDFDFISRVENYRDGFAATDRRNWKKT